MRFHRPFATTPATALAPGFAAALLAAVTTSSTFADTTTIASPNAINNGHFGAASAGIPDVNGDGFGDFIVGAPQESSGANSGAGRVHVFSGKTGLLLRSHLSPNIEVNGAFGTSVAGISDINGDGKGDYLVGAPFENNGTAVDSGRVYVYSGATGALIRTHDNPTPTSGGHFGISLGAVPDATNDGLSEYVVGAPGNGVGGRAYVFRATGSLLQTLSSPNEVTDGEFGIAVSGVPDVTGDGLGEVVIGAPRESPSGGFEFGAAYIIRANNGNLFKTLASSTPIDFGRFGAAVCGIADVTGDNRGDVLVGAPFEQVPSATEGGRAYLINGFTGATVFPMVSGDPEFNGHFGACLTAIGDVTGDAKVDILVGAPDEDGLPGSALGHAYILHGVTGALVETISAGTSGNRSVGSSVASVPDANLDGQPDYIVGAATDDDGSPVNDGRVIFVRDLSNDVCSGSIPSLTNGVHSLSTIGASGDASGTGCAGLITNDIFFKYIASCTGTLEVTTCLSHDFDTVLAVYQGCSFVPVFGTCAFGPPIGCNDNGCSVGSKVQTNVTAGNCYRIRVGGIGGQTGSFKLNITCTPDCAGDTDADGEIDAADLGAFLGAWGTSNPTFDFDGSGTVDAADLGLLLGNWGSC
jgi:FG-GAP repeat